MLRSPAWCVTFARAYAGKRARHRDVEHLRAQTAADDENVQRAAAPGKALFRRGQRRDVGAHRVAGPAGMGQCVGKAGEHAIGHAREHAVGQTGDRILFVQHQRDAAQRRHHAARKRDVAAESQHHLRAHAGEHAQRLPEAAQQVQRQHELAQQALAAQRGEADGLQFVAARRHDARLHAVRVAQPHHMPAAAAQLVGHRQSGVDVAAGAAGHHECGGHVRLHRRFSQSMRSRMASAMQLTRMPEPP
jgi:hypothetical protein